MPVTALKKDQQPSTRRVLANNSPLLTNAQPNLISQPPVKTAVTSLAQHVKKQKKGTTANKV